MSRARKSAIPSSSKVRKRVVPTEPAGEHKEGLFDLVAQSQKSFRELIDSFDCIAFNLSLDGKVCVINRRFTEIAGLPFSAIVNHSLEEFIDEPSSEDLARALPHILKQRAWGGIVRVRWRNRTEPRFYDCTIYAVLKDGEVSGVSGLARDISMQREAESRFTDLFETLHEGVYFATPSGDLLDVNPAMVRILGYESKDELLKLPMSRHFADATAHTALTGELQKTGSIREREVSLRRKNGSIVHAINSGVAIRDARGEVVRFQGSLVDVTEREQMQKRLREEQEFVRRLVACFPDIIAVLDKEGRYTFVSPRIQEILGYTPEEFVGVQFEDRAHPEDRPVLADFFRDLIHAETNVGAVEFRTAHKHGGWRKLRLNASPLRDGDGRIIGIVASARDVTEARQMEEQLLQSEKLAAIGQMVSGVAHELNNPLTAILGVSDLLRERAADESSRRQSEIINKQARKAAELVQSLLMFSRPARPQSQRVRLQELVARAIAVRKNELERRHIHVQVDAQADLPMIEANPNQIVQVLVNIITNAEEAISTQRDHGEMTVRIVASDDSQEILIDDNGPGIEPEIRSRIFDPFFTTHRSTGGAGLGLTIALVIVKEHGGTIEALTSPSGGARLRILLQATKPSIPKVSRPDRNRLQGSAVLVIEDEQGVRELVEESLKGQGATVHCVSTSADGQRSLQENSYDAVLCDFNLGNASGFELFERVLAEKKSATPPFVFMTGELLDQNQISKLQQKGARALQKPFQISELVATVETAILSSKAEPLKR